MVRIGYREIGLVTTLEGDGLGHIAKLGQTANGLGEAIGATDHLNRVPGTGCVDGILQRGIPHPVNLRHIGNTQTNRICVVIRIRVARHSGGDLGYVGQHLHRQVAAQDTGNGDDAHLILGQVLHLPGVGQYAHIGLGNGHPATDHAGAGHADRYLIGDNHIFGHARPVIGKSQGIRDR